MVRDEYGFFHLMQTREGTQRILKSLKKQEEEKDPPITKNSVVTSQMINNVSSTILRKTEYAQDDPGFPQKSWSRTLWNESYAKLRHKDRRMLKWALYYGKRDLFVRNVNSVIIKERCNLIDRASGENIKIVRTTTPIIYDLDKLSDILHNIVFHVATSYETEIPFYQDDVVKSNREVHCHVKALIRLTDGTYIPIFGPVDKLLKAIRARAVISPKAKNGFVIEYY